MSAWLALVVAASLVNGIVGPWIRKGILKELCTKDAETPAPENELPIRPSDVQGITATRDELPKVKFTVHCKFDHEAITECAYDGKTAVPYVNEGKMGPFTIKGRPCYITCTSTQYPLLQCVTKIVEFTKALGI